MSSKTFSRLVLVAAIAGFACPALAQLNLPNPLIEPHSKGRGSPQGPVLPGSLPPLPSEQTLQKPVSGSDGQSAVSTARTQLASFSVTAIVGSKAVLRRVSTASANPTLSGGPSMSPIGTGQISMGGVGASTVQASTMPRSETLTLRDGQTVDVPGVDGDFVAKVRDEKAVIYLISGGRKTAVFAGEVEGAIVQPKTITLQTKDTEYRAAITTKAVGGVGQSSNSAAATSTPSSQPGSGTQ
jgi:hypothetical protein